MRGHRLVSHQDLSIRIRCIPDQLRIWSILSGNALAFRKVGFSDNWSPVRCATCPNWVKQRRTHCEQMSSELPPKADIAQCSRHVSKVPKNEPASAGGAGGTVGRLRLPQ